MSAGIKIIADNRRARHEYHLEERFEAGMSLHGSEVKSLREGKANLQEAFASVQGGEVVLHNLHIAPYSHGGYSNHEPVRPRKLLLRRAEIVKLEKATQQKGFTLIPTKLYFKTAGPRWRSPRPAARSSTTSGRISRSANRNGGWSG